ncbi:thiol:disulfide interchange protein DsbA/DsbL, partial [Lysobacter sp. A3-1-A15]
PAQTDSQAQAGDDAPATPPAPGEAAPLQGPAPVAGVEYFEIAGGQPFAPGPAGTVEVVEVFGYTCPACARFEPLVAAWKARQPAYVRFTPVAAPFGGYWMPYAKAFYAADSMGLREKTHDAMFQAIHVDRSLPVQGVTDEQVAAFYAGHGADANAFAGAMSSFAVDARMKRAAQFLQRSGVDATPTMVVDGKYRIAGGIPYEDVLRITDHLVARARAENAPVAPAAEADATDADA